MFRDRFVELLQSKDVSAYKLSKESGIDEASISRWKKGAELPSVDNLIKLAAYFGCSVDYLLGISDDPMPYSAFPKSEFDDDLITEPFVVSAPISKLKELVEFLRENGFEYEITDFTDSKE